MSCWATGPDIYPLSPRDDLQWNTMVTYHDVNLQKLEICPESNWLLLNNFLWNWFSFLCKVGGREGDLRELPWWLSGEESTWQCKRHGFNPWSGNIPHAMEQQTPCTVTAQPCAPKPRSCNYWSLHILLFCNKRNHWEARASQLESSPWSRQKEKKPAQQQSPRTAKNKSK